MNELLFYAILANVVRAFPAVYEFEGGPESTCRRPNTFAVLTDIADLNTGNLLKASPRYQQLPVFYSRKWENAGFAPSALAFDYPLLAVVPQSYTAVAKDRYLDWTLDIALIDQNAYPKGGASYCENRTYEEHMTDCRVMLMRCLNQARRFSVWANEASGQRQVLPPGATAPSPWIELELVDDLISPRITLQYIRDAYQDNLSGLFGSLTVSLEDCRILEPNMISLPQAVVFGPVTDGDTAFGPITDGDTAFGTGSHLQGDKFYITDNLCRQC